jgi:hypothetical protein
MISAVNFWDMVGDDMGLFPPSGDQVGCAEVRGKLCGECGDCRLRIGPLGGDDDLGRRADRQAEQCDQALGVGFAPALAEHDPTLEPRSRLHEAGSGTGVQAGRVGDEEGQFWHH